MAFRYAKLLAAVRAGNMNPGLPERPTTPLPPLDEEDEAEGLEPVRAEQTSAAAAQDLSLLARRRLKQLALFMADVRTGRPLDHWYPERVAFQRSSDEPDPVWERLQQAKLYDDSVSGWYRIRIQSRDTS